MAPREPALTLGIEEEYLLVDLDTKALVTRQDPGFMRACQAELGDRVSHELLQSQVALVTAKRDAYVAGFQLLNAMGQAEAQDLGLDGGPLYDPLGNYRRVAGNWSDWASDPRHPTVATRTVSPQELPPNPVVTPQIDSARIDPSPPVTPGVTQPPQ